MMKEIYFYTKDNVKIAVNQYQQGFDKVLIIAPGWFMTKDSKPFYNMSIEFSKYLDVLALDFRGHGKSGGCFTFTSNEVKDLNTVLDFAKNNYNKIYLAGFSLGGASSIIEASENKYINKMIVVSTPSDFNKIENNWWKKEAWLPTIKKCEPKVWMSVRAGNIFQKKIKPVDIIEKVICPTLFIAGEKDPTVYSRHTKLLYEKAKCEKKFVEFKECYHAEDLYIQEHDKFMELCMDWLCN